jgi:hypothetical protein
MRIEVCKFVEIFPSSKAVHTGWTTLDNYKLLQLFGF